MPKLSDKELDLLRLILADYLENLDSSLESKIDALYRKILALNGEKNV
jgi:hypothetical protein